MNYTDYLLLSLIQMVHLLIKTNPNKMDEAKKADKLMEGILKYSAEKEDFDKQQQTGEVSYTPETKTKSFSKRFWGSKKKKE